MTDNVFDVVLWVSLLGVVAVALFARKRMVASITYLVMGLLLAVVWARLGAPDIALAEAAIGSGVTGALLVAAVTEHPRGPRDDRKRRLAVLEVLAGGVVAAAMSVAFVLALRDGAHLPRLGDEVLATVPQAAVSYPVTAVLLDFRAYDTLLEIAVLTTAAAAAVAVHRTGRIDTVALPTDSRPILLALVRLVVPMLLVVAAWSLVAGTTRAGGAFQAGAILTGALIALFLSNHLQMATAARWLVPAALVGLTGFLITAFSVAALGHGWLVFDEPWGGAAVLAVETAMALGIGAALATVFLAGFPDGADDGRT